MYLGKVEVNLFTQPIFPNLPFLCLPEKESFTVFSDVFRG